MRAGRALTCLCLGIAVACATPGQVRRVETQVAILDREHARADSARAADLQRVQQGQRQNMDSINLLVRQLNENIQRLSRETSGNFDNLQKQLYQVANVANNTQSSVKRLGSAIETAVSAPTSPGDTTTRAAASGGIPQPDALIFQAGRMMDQSAYPAARVALNTLLQTYPRAAEVPQALLLLGKSFDPSDPDSARTYYTRVWRSFPDSPYAPTALFKLGELELRAQNRAIARSYFQQIVDRYKQSDEFDSAQTRLRENP